uniref:Cell division cycle associated 8 n=1 Tax=Neogobius melanostomus TaxID=47308 RepID=A0A8C6STQ5_9GOBI
MAPRKRTTKQPKNNPKTAKLEAFLEDFDSEGKNTLLLSRYLSGEALVCDNTRIRKDASKYCYKILINLLTPPEPSAFSPVWLYPNLETRATRKPPTTSKRTKALSVNKQNSTIRRSNRKPLVTPARTMMDSSLMMGSTPLITPRFDPRVPRHKERVYSISVNGSPVAAGNSEVVITVPIGNGESIELLASQMESVDLSLLDETALRSIRQLQNRLTSLCGPSE